MDVTELRAISLAQKLVGGKSAERISQDVRVRYSADAWVYIAQQASVALTSVASSLLAAYIYDRSQSHKPLPRIQNIVTRQVKEGLVEYKRAIDNLRDYRASGASAKKLIDVYVIEGSRVIKMLEQVDIGDLDLLEVLEEYRGLTVDEVQQRANQYFPAIKQMNGVSGQCQVLK